MNMPACFCFRASAELSRLAWGAALVLQLASPSAGYGAPLGPWPQQSPSLRQHLSQPGRPLWRRLVRRGGIGSSTVGWSPARHRASSGRTPMWSDSEEIVSWQSLEGRLGLWRRTERPKEFFFSTTGEVWAAGVVSRASSVYEDVVYADGRFVAVGGDIATSIDGRTRRAVWSNEPRRGFRGVVRGTTE